MFYKIMEISVPCRILINHNKFIILSIVKVFNKYWYRFAHIVTLKKLNLFYKVKLNNGNNKMEIKMILKFKD